MKLLRSRISKALSNSHAADSFDDEKLRIGTYIERNIRSSETNEQQLSVAMNLTQLPELLDVNDFVLEALIMSNTLQHERDLLPIITFIRGLRIGSDGAISKTVIYDSIIHINISFCIALLLLTIVSNYCL